MNYLFINGIYPQYSQTFVDDQIKYISSFSKSKVQVFAKKKSPQPVENFGVGTLYELIYAKPFSIVSSLRIAVNFFKHPIRCLKSIRHFVLGNIDTTTLLLALQIDRTPDIAITHFGSNFRQGVELKRFLFPDMKNVIVFHGHDISSYIHKNGWGTYANISEDIDLAITVNQKWQKILLENTDISRVKTIYLGTKVPEVLIRRNNVDTSYDILFAGRFVEKKGFDDLFRAILLLQEISPRDLRVHCVGGGELLHTFERRCIDENIQSFVFYGPKNQKFVQKLMLECDLLVAPSKTAKNGDSEGIPVVLMEAMAMGIPIVSTTHSGIPELIKNNETGILVPEGNVGKLSDAISFAMSNEYEMACMASNAFTHVTLYHNQLNQLAKFFSETELLHG